VWPAQRSSSAKDGPPRAREGDGPRCTASPYSTCNVESTKVRARLRSLALF